ncbi:GNAT family N-acetyltransferase [Sporomusa aerivorans]|uniref:GNAT family N-acetyltransferase n=1 Tax=Sporomusa aerivorans TaxID=204936 RepID=UPI00352BCFF4
MNVLETNRLMIREHSYNDIAKLHQIFSNPLTMSFWPAPFTLQQTETWVKSNIIRYHELGFGRWSVLLKETGEIIGDCGIVISEIDGKQENDLGYIIHYPYWHNGFAVEAADACRNYAFTELKFNRLCANMPYNHAGSRKTAEKIGMTKEKEFYNRRNRDIRTFLYSIATSQ